MKNLSTEKRFLLNQITSWSSCIIVFLIVVAALSMFILATVHRGNIYETTPYEWIIVVFALSILTRMGLWFVRLTKT